MIARRLLVSTAAASMVAASLFMIAPRAKADASCTLPVGTAGTPDLPGGGTSGLSALAPAPSGLPKQIYFRTTTTTYNTSWAFILKGGRVYTKPVAAIGGWRVVPLPRCLDGTIIGISVDDDEMVAIGPGLSIYTMDHALNGPSLWNWTSRYGTPFWLGGGNTLPVGTRDWSWSVDSPNTTKTWTDGAGNAQPIGFGKVSHVYALMGDGSKITFIDPWLAVDHSFHLETPLDGRFEAARISVSGSTMFLINKYGDMYTRQDDFDIDGSDSIFYRYSYDSQRGKPAATNASLQLLPTYAAVQLPVPGWMHQPKIPGSITGVISIAQDGVGSAARELRVEGRWRGHNGYWRKALDAPRWTFVRTNQPLSHRLQANPTGDWSRRTLSAPDGFTYTGHSPGYRVTARGFAVASEMTPLMVTFADGRRLHLVLHAVDALRQNPMPDGLAATPRSYNAAVEVPASVLAHPDRLSTAERIFLTNVLKNQRFTTTTMSVTTASMSLLGWTLTR